MRLLARLVPRTLVGRVAAGSLILFLVSIPALWLIVASTVRSFARDVVDTQIATVGSQLRGYWASTLAGGGDGEGPVGSADLEWVWQITVDGEVVDRSELLRLAGVTLTRTVDAPSPSFAMRTASTALGVMRLAERVVDELPPADAAPRRVHYLVALSGERYEAYVDQHAQRLGELTFLVMIPAALCLLALMAALVLVVRHDLRALTRAMARFRRGETSRIEGRFPADLRIPVDRMNVLLAHNAKLLDRTRRYVTKIAHDLNHPLAVIRNALGTPADAALIRRQVDRMTGLIDRYASLARAIGPDAPVRHATDVTAVLADIRDGYAILYRREPVEIAVDAPADLRFPVARHDLEAMIGNLVGNAHKHARRHIRVSARPDEAGLLLAVDDDGPGIPEARRQAVFNWGKRLDEAPPGTGFGLTIVRDLADLYGGEVTLGQSDLGGLRAMIRLPGIAEGDVVALEPRARAG